MLSSNFVKEYMKIIYVKWKDAVYNEGPLIEKHISDYIVCESVGFLVRDDGESLVIAQEMGEDRAKYRHAVSIPKINIIKRKVVNIKP